MGDTVMASEMMSATRVYGEGGRATADHVAAPMLLVAWRRRWTFILVTSVCMAIGGAYLYKATPLYVATARVLVQNVAPKVLSETVTERDSSGSEGENYLQTQGDVVQSAPVLQRAMDAVEWWKMRTFAAAEGDPIGYLRRVGVLSVEASRKSATISIAVESSDAAEAAKLANAVAGAYIDEVGDQRKVLGVEITRALRNERTLLERQRENVVASMATLKRQMGVVAPGENGGNSDISRETVLSAALTDAQIATIDLRAQQEAIRGALVNPESIRAYAESHQPATTSGDREYDELRTELTQAVISLASRAGYDGAKNPRMQIMQDAVDALRQRLAAKERSMVESQLADVSGRLVAAEEKVNELRSTLESQRGRLVDATGPMGQYAGLSAQAARILTQCDLLDLRIAEVNANNVASKPLHIRLMEAALVPTKPAKPNRMLVMAAAFLIGMLAGLGAALAREARDSRIKSPGDIPVNMGISVLASVPHSRWHSLAHRGQLLRMKPHSAAAEAYRSIRTCLRFGSTQSARTFLIASAMPQDGKSTTASNLAIAFAQAGERTLLLDCDLREPVQHLIFQTGQRAGLTSVLDQQVELQEAISGTQVPGLYVLPSGPLPTNPSELLSGERFTRLLKAIGMIFDRIVIDSPPLAKVSDAAVLAAAADATLLVVRMNKSRSELGVMAVDVLERVGARLVGAVANETRRVDGWAYGGAAQRPWRLPESEERQRQPGGVAELTARTSKGTRNDRVDAGEYRKLLLAMERRERVISETQPSVDAVAQSQA